MTAVLGSFNLQFVVEVNGAEIFLDTISSALDVDKVDRFSQARNTSGDIFSAGDTLSVKLKPAPAAWGGTDTVTIDNVPT